MSLKEVTVRTDHEVLMEVDDNSAIIKLYFLLTIKFITEDTKAIHTNITTK